MSQACIREKQVKYENAPTKTQDCTAGGVYVREATTFLRPRNGSSSASLAGGLQNTRPLKKHPLSALHCHVRQPLPLLLCVEDAGAGERASRAAAQHASRHLSLIHI